jgi:L-ascorbate metabolism protein UlaG (beta-lactamase superfamily)
MGTMPIPVEYESSGRFAGLDRLTFIGHATTQLTLGETTILTDPFLRRGLGPLRRQAPAPDRELLDSTDVVVVSHLHRDHLDRRSLRRLSRAATVVVPRGAGRLASRATDAEVVELSFFESASVEGVDVTAVPALHHGGRGPWSRQHAFPVGYVLESDRRRVYFAGDTDLYPQMKDLRPLDLALLPIWGWGPNVGPGHLDPARAAQALRLLRPELAVPIHWGTFYPLGLRRLKPEPLTEPPREFARLAGELAPEVTVRVLAPGESLDLEEDAQ